MLVTTERGVGILLSTPTLSLVFFLVTYILTEDDMIVVLILVSLMASETEHHFFIFSLAIVFLVNLCVCVCAVCMQEPMGAKRIGWRLNQGPLQEQ